MEKLTWELDFFVRHFLEGLPGRHLTPARARRAADEWPAIASELAAEPRVLCHRDYHSRNLMLHDGRLHIIDFQDARLGPDTYDLASLLRDSYVDIERARARRAHRLLSRAERARAHRRPATAAEFRRRFDLMALQRNLKALGTFGYQTTARGNPVYIQYMPRTLRYARSTLVHYPRFARLTSCSPTHVEELR